MSPANLARSSTPSIVVLVPRRVLLANAAPPSGEPVFRVVPPRCSNLTRGVRCGRLLDDCDGHQ